MNAVVFREHGDPGVLVYTDIETPAPASGEVLVRVRATTVNRADTVVRRGYPGLVIPLPHVPGGDIAGTIEALGEGVAGWTPGDRVVCHPLALEAGYSGDEFWRVGWQYFGMHRQGSYAELVNVPASCLVRLPDHVPFEMGACVPVAALTAEHALNVGGVGAGTTLFYWGGAGGLGTMLVQLAKRRGARVLTTVGSPDRRRLLESLGADLVIDRHTQDVPTEVRAFAPTGVDVVLDYVGPATFPVSFGMLRPGGTLLWCGMISGREVTVNVQATYLKHASIRGLFLGSMRELRDLVGHLAAGELVPHLHMVMPLAEARRGHEMMERGEHAGKVVLVP